jgi:Thioesterase-like superfamily
MSSDHTPAVDLTPALFVPVGDAWLPTAYARGPWSPNALHGGPVAALVTRAIEAVEAPVPARLTRLTLELLRPVPLTPLLVRTEVRRPGAKVATIEATVTRRDDGTVLAIARAQRIRSVAVDMADGAADQVPELPDEPSVIGRWPGTADVTFHADAIEHRFLWGDFASSGPAFDWMRLRVPVVPEEVPSAWQRTAAVADFTNGISSVVGFEPGAMFINPDLTVHLWREPVGEWVGSDAVTRTSDSGIGLAQTALWDRDGRIGTGLQSLLLERS